MFMSASPTTCSSIASWRGWSSSWSSSSSGCPPHRHSFQGQARQCSQGWDPGWFWPHSSKAGSWTEWHLKSSSSCGWPTKLVPKLSLIWLNWFFLSRFLVKLTERFSIRVQFSFVCTATIALTATERMWWNTNLSSLHIWTSSSEYRASTVHP